RLRRVMAAAAGQYGRGCASKIENQTIRPTDRRGPRELARCTPRMRRVAAVEEAVLDADPADAIAIYERLVRLQAELAPRPEFVNGAPRTPVIRTLVGSVQASANRVLDVAPKTAPDTDWQTAVIDLLAVDRIHAGGLTQKAELAQRSLADAFAYL